MVQKKAALIGIHALRADETSHFNPRNVSVLLIFGLFASSSTAFIVFDAKSVRDYEEAFFPWISLSFVCVGFIFNIVKSDQIYVVCDTIENLIESGE